jgi:hypothetical protein
MNPAAAVPPRPTLSRGLRIALVTLVALGVPLGVAIIWLTWWSAVSWVGVFLLAFSPMSAASLVSRFFPSAKFRPAMMRYRDRLGITMVIYFMTLLLTTELYRRGYTAGVLGWALAILPALPIVAIFGLYARYFQEETDEMMRKMVMTSLIWSGALTLCEATVWGFLETFEKVPHLWMWAAPVAFFAQTGITGPLAGRKFA